MDATTMGIQARFSAAANANVDPWTFQPIVPMKGETRANRVGVSKEPYFPQVPSKLGEEDYQQEDARRTEPGPERPPSPSELRREGKTSTQANDLMSPTNTSNPRNSTKTLSTGVKPGQGKAPVNSVNKSSSPDPDDTYGAQRRSGTLLSLIRRTGMLKTRKVKSKSPRPPQIPRDKEDQITGLQVTDKIPRVSPSPEISINPPRSSISTSITHNDDRDPALPEIRISEITDDTELKIEDPRIPPRISTDEGDEHLGIYANGSQLIRPASKPAGSQVMVQVDFNAMKAFCTFSVATQPSSGYVIESIAKSMAVAIRKSYDNLGDRRRLLCEDSPEISKRCGWSSDQHIPAGSHFVTFETIQHLGNGSLSVVEEVCLRPLQSLVRKRVQIPYGRARQYRRYLEQEVQTLKSLTHPHIVKIIGSYEDGPQSKRQFYSILMSPVGDGDLNDFLARSWERGENTRRLLSPNSLNTVKEFFCRDVMWLCTWFTCLASALAYMHGTGVRHQDIKPSNIIYKGANVLFTDFSSSTQFILGATTSTESPARTSPMYSAPETTYSFEGDDVLVKHGLGSDIFSLGCVFLEMLTVLSLRSVDDMRRFCWNVPNFGATNGMTEDEQESIALVGFRYCDIAIERVESWFQQCQNTLILTTFQLHVKPLLSRKRNERPSAADILGRLLKDPPLQITTLACPCWQQEL